ARSRRRRDPAMDRHEIRSEGVHHRSSTHLRRRFEVSLPSPRPHLERGACGIDWTLDSIAAFEQGCHHENVALCGGRTSSTGSETWPTPVPDEHARHSTAPLNCVL